MTFEIGMAEVNKGKKIKLKVRHLGRLKTLLWLHKSFGGGGEDPPLWHIISWCSSPPNLHLCFGSHLASAVKGRSGTLCVVSCAGKVVCGIHFDAISTVWLSVEVHPKACTSWVCFRPPMQLITILHKDAAKRNLDVLKMNVSIILQDDMTRSCICFSLGWC